MHASYTSIVPKKLGHRLRLASRARILDQRTVHSGRQAQTSRRDDGIGGCLRVTDNYIVPLEFVLLRELTRTFQPPTHEVV